MGLHGLAEETLRVTDSGTYTAPSGQAVIIGPAVRAAIAGTRLYTPSDLADLLAKGLPSGSQTAITVTTECTSQAGQRLVAEGASNVAVLNFASARRVGGGFLSGARAQEEEVCRASALYRCLETQPAYYASNRQRKDALYTDHIIYSPAVPFFRDTARKFVDTPTSLSVITAPAPNTSAVMANDPGLAGEIGPTFVRRAAMVLAVAADQGHEVLVLGAWGCGAFGGDPVVAADAFAVALEGPFAGRFRQVVFGILVARKADQANLTAFQARFGT